MIILEVFGAIFFFFFFFVGCYFKVFGHFGHFEVLGFFAHYKEFERILVLEFLVYFGYFQDFRNLFSHSTNFWVILVILEVSRYFLSFKEILELISVILEILWLF